MVSQTTVVSFTGLRLQLWWCLLMLPLGLSQDADKVEEHCYCRLSAAKKSLGHLLNESVEALVVPCHSASLLVAAHNNPAHVSPFQRHLLAAGHISHQTAICLPVLLDGLGSSVRRQGLWERLRA